MKNLLFCFLMALVVPVFGQDLSITASKKGVYQIYSLPLVPAKILVDSLTSVDPDVPEHLLLEIYRKGVFAYYSDVVAMNYSYKDIWLKRTKNIDYKIAVYHQDTKSIKATVEKGIPSKGAAIEIYFLLLSLLIIFCALFYVATGNYNRSIIHEKDRFSFLMYMPIFVNLITTLILSFIIGGIAIWSSCLALFFFFAVVSYQSAYSWTKEKYLNYQKVNFLLAIYAIGTITLSLVLVLILLIVLSLIFFLLSRSAFYKIIGLEKRLKDKRSINALMNYRRYLWDSRFFVQRYFSHKK